MEREKWKENCNSNSNNYSNTNGYCYDRFVFDDYDGEVPSAERSPAKPSSLNSSPPRLGYIEHHVSKYDTLAGVAIKYGVEVADVKRLNNLVTDHQMFALKTLHIPLPGRHPPSPCLSNGSTTPGYGNSDHNSPTTQAHHDLLDSFPSLKMKSSERKVSPAMSSLQGFYGLKGSSIPSEDGFPRNLSTSGRPLSHHRKSKSLVNVILEEIMEKSNEASAAITKEVDSSKWNYNLVQRRQKSVADFSRIPELLLREDNSSTGVLPPRTGKGLALRQKVASRTTLATDSEQNGLSPAAMGMGDATLNEGSSRVRKSSSTSCLHDQDNSGSSSIWPTSMWNLKPDLQALSTAAIGKPIFDGLPKPITGRKNKAALD
ncbi:hypothetical protein LR48_Vigan06g140200 [Vigna angularis]|uniref:F-box protein n=2 Tax=Phaseolus angularis TaxID=3914 RepID=A0A0L9UTP5_PHAAN|nr:uncharacterized protein LOC108334551 [Vigna angularis]KAG2377268.1 F-box protein [Vigna angularis]KOM46096.1 hypothetical protein LR48_Vigan06g140200 [Vigna angularis]BAT98739.1 hypothetical protein VIGAN_10006800 [Vigna angularis var. angularis]